MKRHLFVIPWVVLSALARPAVASPRDGEPDDDDERGLADVDVDAPARAPRERFDPGDDVALPLAAPPVATVLSAAYRASGLDHDGAVGRRARARWSALLPWVTLRAYRGDSRDLGTFGQPDEVTSHLTYEARATWRLDRLLYDPAEYRDDQSRLARMRQRRELGRDVVRLYYAWRRAAARAPRGLMALERAAELDALTDGAFGELLAAARARDP